MNEEELDPARARLKIIANEHLERGDAVGWFDKLYRDVEGKPEMLPWGDLKPNRFLLEWVEKYGLEGNGRSALVVGSGLGDEAFFLEDRGFVVTAFDVSEKAIEWAKEIRPDSNVDFHVADLFAPPEEWRARFDLVLEVYTVQALPPELREKSIAEIVSFVAPCGEIIVVERHRENDEVPEGLPWSLSPDDLKLFEVDGIRFVSRDEFLGDEEQPLKRFVVRFKKTE